ncbi:hypothetical protein V491_08669, partial [Pseudogymnoascus sp. VKM F-3775]
TAHVGRGGAANIVRVPTRGAEEDESLKSVLSKDEKEERGRKGRVVKEVKEEKEVKGKGKGKSSEGAPAPEEGVVERGRKWVAGLMRRGSAS